MVLLQSWLTFLFPPSQNKDVVAQSSTKLIVIGLVSSAAALGTHNAISNRQSDFLLARKKTCAMRAHTDSMPPPERQQFGRALALQLLISSLSDSARWPHSARRGPSSLGRNRDTGDRGRMLRSASFLPPPSAWSTTPAPRPCVRDTSPGHLHLFACPHIEMLALSSAHLMA